MAKRLRRCAHNALILGSNPSEPKNINRRIILLKCKIVQLAMLAATNQSVDPEVLVSIALHETHARVVKGDRGKAIGPWQLRCDVWLQVPCRGMKLSRQAKFAAGLYSKYTKRRRTVAGAIQLWNSRSKNYGKRVLKRLPEARKLIRSCHAAQK